VLTAPPSPTLGSTPTQERYTKIEEKSEASSFAVFYYPGATDWLDKRMFHSSIVD
jgi:hypothetical protein